MNLGALASQAESNYHGNQKMSIAKDMVRTSSPVPSSPGMDLDGALLEKDKLLPVDLRESYASSNLGPLLSSSSELNCNWGVFGKLCRINRPRMVDEVHLRRFDGLLVTDCF